MTDRQDEQGSKAAVRFICTRCGYDMSGLPTRVCPECGGVRVRDIEPFPPPPAAARALFAGASLLGVMSVSAFVAGGVERRWAEDAALVQGGAIVASGCVAAVALLIALLSRRTGTYYFVVSLFAAAVVVASLCLRVR